MKYMWLNQNGIRDSLNMENSGDFMRREYNIQVMDNPQYDSPKKVKRYRSAFTTDQVNYLEKQFKKFPYIGNTHRKDVALALNIPERAVKIWFQNRRMKEKKETTNKEFDKEAAIPMSLELTKDQLNNVSAQSANELHPRSLPLLTDMSHTTCNNRMGKNNSPFNNIQDLGIKESREIISFTAPQNVVTTTKVIHPPSVYVRSEHSPSDYKTSAELSIDLCKKYKGVPFSSPACVDPSIKRETTEINKVEHKSTKREGQIMPEDLSPSRKPNYPAMFPQPPPSNNPSNNSGLVSLVPTISQFYAQPYISASGVIWKPVSVMPVIPPSSTPLSASNKPFLNTVQETVTRCCNCDCHTKTQAPLNFQQPSPSPQYIFTAVPFQNPSTF